MEQGAVMQNWFSLSDPRTEHALCDISPITWGERLSLMEIAIDQAA